MKGNFMKCDKIFMTDLDGTIIYSDRHEFHADKVPVDSYNGHASYMNKRLYDSLDEFNKMVPFIPITTRSLDQYERIKLPIVPNYALVLNGAILVTDGHIDDNWLAESRYIIKDCQKQMNYAKDIIESAAEIFHISKMQYINQFFIFAKTDCPNELVNLLNHSIDLKKLDVYNKKNKVYVLPKQLSKGNAVTRLKKRLNVKYVMAAGDSEMDIPMLKIADEVIPCDILKEKGEYL
jgi:hydroxymethylpyrimidine pyrophosphatase-like HAD family hydrolase